MSDDLLCIKNLSVQFDTRNGVVQAVRDVSLSLKRGETLGIVGESGSGKSVTAYAVTRLLERSGKITSGAIIYAGRHLENLSEAEMRKLRGPAISIVFQNARAALNPIRTVGQQITDALAAHSIGLPKERLSRARSLLKDVNLIDIERVMKAYPHELSGGMCQRVMIAIAIACEPDLLIADEATTGLDVTTQKVVMDLLSAIATARGMGLILITHDLGLAAQYCNNIVVMRQGQVVESSTVESVFLAPQHAYTKALVAASPTAVSTIDDLVVGDTSTPVDALKPFPSIRPDTRILEVQGLSKEYDGFKAVQNVSFSLNAGASIGLVGESGSGKSTISRIVTRLIDKSAGSVNFEGQNIGDVTANAFPNHPVRREIQIVFQDPHDSLNPRFTAFDCIAQPLRSLERSLDKETLASRVSECAERVGLPLELLSRFPHQLSGGQKARIGIARAIATRPKLLILDEPTAALDVSVQAVVLKLLHKLRLEQGLAFLFVSHDLNVVRMLCERIIVLKGGEVVEEASAAEIFRAPNSDYTRSLIDAIPSLEARAQLSSVARV